jgi:TolB-like protein
MAELRAELEQLAATANNRQPSIAVLPFENMSGDKENEYFSDGLAEEIINALTRIPGLKVIARTSAFAFKGKHEDVRRIAEVLGVTTVLEGSVRKAGSRVRVTAQLITAADGTHLWSERYDREMIDVFAIQDEIAAAITEALQIKLATTSARQRYKPTLPAYEALLKGRQFILSHAVESQAPAQVWLERAIALDPGYAEPHANLGLSYFLLSTMGMRALRETMPLIRTEANEALRLEPLNLIHTICSEPLLWRTNTTGRRQLRTSRLPWQARRFRRRRTGPMRACTCSRWATSKRPCWRWSGPSSGIR